MLLDIFVESNTQQASHDIDLSPKITCNKTSWFRPYAESTRLEI